MYVYIYIYTSLSLSLSLQARDGRKRAAEYQGRRGARKGGGGRANDATLLGKRRNPLTPLIFLCVGIRGPPFCPADISPSLISLVIMITMIIIIIIIIIIMIIVMIIIFIRILVIMIIVLIIMIIVMIVMIMIVIIVVVIVLIIIMIIIAGAPSLISCATILHEAHVMRTVHPVSITRFPLRRFSPGAGLLRNRCFHR